MARAKSALKLDVSKAAFPHETSFLHRQKEEMHTEEWRYQRQGATKNGQPRCHQGVRRRGLPTRNEQIKAKVTKVGERCERARETYSENGVAKALIFPSAKRASVRWEKQKTKQNTE